MRTTILFFALLLGFAACTPRITTTPTKKVTTIPSSDAPTLSGTWTLVESSSIGGLSTHHPDDIIWHFGKANNSDVVSIITKVNDTQTSDFMAMTTTHPYSTNEYIVNINDELYFYSFSNGHLILDSNVDPVVSSDNTVMTFEKTETTIHLKPATVQPDIPSRVGTSIGAVAIVYPVNDNGEIGECLETNSGKEYKFGENASLICDMNQEQVRELTDFTYSAVDMCECRTQFCGTKKTEQFINCLKGKELR